MRRLQIGFVVSTVVVVGVGLATGFGLSSSQGAPASAGSPDCDYRETHNTAKLRATPVGFVKAGARLNGTGGSVWFTSLPQNDPYGIHEVRLVGPGGTEVGPIHPIATDVLFHDVPLCETGLWRLVDHDTNVTLSRFWTTTNTDMPGPGTVSLDHPVQYQGTASYDAGESFSTDNSARCGYRGDTRVSMPAGEARPMNVSVDWTVEQPDADEVFVTIQSDGANGTPITTTHIPDWGNGTTSVYPTWTSPSVVDVQFATWLYRNGEFWAWCGSARSIAVGPGFGQIQTP